MREQWGFSVLEYFCIQAFGKPLKICSVVLKKSEGIQCDSVRKVLVLLAVTSLLLSGCGSKTQDGEKPLPSVSAGKSATVVLSGLMSSSSPSGTQVRRPSGTMGVFTSLFLAQNLFFPTQSAVTGIEEMLRIVQGQEEPLNDETFTLLQTLGDALAVNIVDLLNRSPDRVETLNQYVAALGNAVENGKRRSTELKAALDVLAGQVKEQRATVSQVTKDQRAAIKAKDFSLAGAKEKELVEAQTALSQTQSKQKQTQSSRNQLDDFVELGQRRLTAIEKNREILLSGLQITDPQGLKDLGLVRDASSRGRSFTF